MHLAVTADTLMFLLALTLSEEHMTTRSDLSWTVRYQSAALYNPNMTWSETTVFPQDMNEVHHKINQKWTARGDLPEGGTEFLEKEQGSSAALINAQQTNYGSSIWGRLKAAAGISRCDNSEHRWACACRGMQLAPSSEWGRFMSESGRLMCFTQQFLVLCDGGALGIGVWGPNIYNKIYCIYFFPHIHHQILSIFYPPPYDGFPL